MLELLAELLVELVGEIVIEVVVALGFRTVLSTLSGKASPPVAAFVYAFFGVVLGFSSALVFPHSALHGDVSRIANVVVTPLAVGAVLGALGGWRRRRDRLTIHLDSFGFAYVFALAFAVVRLKTTR